MVFGWVNEGLAPIRDEADPMEGVKNIASVKDVVISGEGPSDTLRREKERVDGR